MRASLTRLAVALALAVSLAGCGGANPKPSPVVESSASSTPSASGAPTLPAEAKGTDAEAAKAFVRHYFDVFAYASNTGDISTLETLGAPNCTSCQRVIDAIQKVYDAGGSASEAAFTFSKLRATPTESGMRVDLTFTASKQYISEASGSPTATVAPLSNPAEFELSVSGNTWIVKRWTRL